VGEVQKALILAAGRGTRMQSLTDEKPKPLLQIGGRPLLARVVESLRQAGLREFCIVTGYRAEQIESYFAPEPGITFRRQEVRDGTARAAQLALEWAGDDDFLLTYGDILTEPVVYTAMAQKLPGYEAVLAVKHVPDPWQGAAVYADGERVTRIIEKPPQGTSTTKWNSAGIYCFRPSLWPELARVPVSPRGEYELTDAVRLLLECGAPVTYYAIPGWWRDVGRPEDLLWNP
jgi:NDP-sugar pyrophosphorylase family protein